MKLYYSPGACSLSPHIVALEAGFDLALEKVDLKNKRTENGRDYLAVTPKGYVPALELDDGTVLTEGQAIVQYLADRAPGSGLAPPNGTFERYRMQEVLAFIGTELHKSYSPLFNPAVLPEVAEERKAYLAKRYALIEQMLAGRPFLTGDRFTVADAYLFTVTNWAGHVGLDLSGMPALGAFQQRVASRPAVQAASAAEAVARAA